jgi:phosphate transport system permease protein
LTLLTTITLVAVVLVNGLGALWPAPLSSIALRDGTTVLGQIFNRDKAGDHTPARVQVKVGNRDLYGLDFRWISEFDITSTETPYDAVAVERMEYGDFYGYVKELHATAAAQTSKPSFEDVHQAWAKVQERRNALETFSDEMAELNRLALRSERKRHELVYKGAQANDTELLELSREEARYKEQFESLRAEHDAALAALMEEQVVFADAAGATQSVPLANIVRLYRPNVMSVAQKLLFYAGKIRELLFEPPRESNTEGGLFPAIFGTVCLVFLMSLVSFPLGVLAGIFLTEYAKEGFLVRAVHIAVNNLAGIPSIVYGIFGLGFFVYGIGGTIDQIFFPERLPTPTFGTGGILWASMTLGILTVPVVIVATEEALSAVPKGVREGSYALGATRLQTLVRTVLPMASPGIMTGLILAMARAAGEVAPLMITGVVKLAPALPVDTEFPFVHLDRKFMHLGFHIYDMGFQSPNAEAAKPMVFVTAFVLVLIVLVMSSAAIYLRKRMRDRYALRSL